MLSSRLEETESREIVADRELLDYAARPIDFARGVLGVELWQKQAEIIQALTTEKHVVVASGHGVGKSFTAATAALWWLYSFSPSLVLTTAPSRRQVESILWKEIRLLWKFSARPLPGRLLNTRVDASATQSAFGFTATEPENAAGQHCPNLLLIIDEASGVADDLFEVLHGALTSGNCAQLWIGNPTRPAGEFYECFHGQRKRGAKTFHISCYDSPNVGLPPGTDPPFPGLVTEQWIAERLADWGEDSDPFRIRVKGLFPKNDPQSLFPLTWLEAAEESGLTETEEPIIMGLDVARYGTCETVAAVRQGENLLRIDAWSGVDLMRTVGRALAICEEMRCARIVVDAVGMGAGVVDRLRELHRVPVLAFESGERAQNAERFRRRRDEAYWGLRTRYEEGRLKHGAKWPVLIGQLTKLRYGYSSSGQVEVETKDQLLRRGSASPDWADAVMLAFATTRTAPRAGALGALRQR